MKSPNPQSAKQAYGEVCRISTQIAEGARRTPMCRFWAVQKEAK